MQACWLNSQSQTLHFAYEAACDCVCVLQTFRNNHTGLQRDRGIRQYVPLVKSLDNKHPSFILLAASNTQDSQILSGYGSLGAGDHAHT
jgi:hypothetical protein